MPSDIPHSAPTRTGEHRSSNNVSKRKGPHSLGSYDLESGSLQRKRTLVRRNRSRHTFVYSAYPNSSPLTGREESNRPSSVHRDNSLEDPNDIQLTDMNAPVETASSKDKYAVQKFDKFNSDADNRSSFSDITLNEDSPETVPLTSRYGISISPRRIRDLNKSHKKFPFWKIYCYCVTFWAPPPLLNLFGLKSQQRQYAWREKMGLISIILVLGLIIAFLTFGFTRSVCRNSMSLTPKDISTGYLVINGRAYNLDSSSHPAAPGISAGSNILYPPANAGGKDGTLLFQNVNGNCKGLITPRDNCTIPHSGEELAWYMPCKLLNMDGSSHPNFTFDYYDGYACHTSPEARKAFYSLKSTGFVHYSWEEISNKSRNFVVYNGNVLDMDILNWIQTDDLDYPNLFDTLKDDKLLRGYDISKILSSSGERRAAQCLIEIAKVGVVDTTTVGCISATIVLYISLIFVLALVIAQFVVACYFKWFVSPRQGVIMSSMNNREKMIEKWTDGKTEQAHIQTIPPERRAGYREKTSSRVIGYHSGNNLKRRALRQSWGGDISEFIDVKKQYVHPASGDYDPKYLTMTAERYLASSKRKSTKMSADNFAEHTLEDNHSTNSFAKSEISSLDPAIVSGKVLKQQPVDWEPFGYPLIHIMCLVTCYSEGESEIRTTLDSVATTDYPNSHKLLVVICDGLITGAGNSKSTPDICLDMMSDLVVNENEVKPYSYVSVAEGSKRHNKAKVYAGFYKYDNNTIPVEKQQKIPMLLIVKCGTPAEAGSAKPGNRGKRDSQIILMSFLESVNYNERMTELEFEMLKSIWQVTGLMATFYEALLMVDADTLVYPDSVTHLAAELVRYPEVMGLCGETRIANKAQSWVTAIQVFEYYISHHQAKAFESVFGSVTCLPGCFCMYRIKAPKDINVWVPILANADIVAKYSENILDSLHRKNLLLLGEDRYLSSLMLRNFPRRKQIFVPKAVCKTVVPDKFKVLLSQRRRWINSTVHNLMELALVKDLCGTFCFSMQFVIIIQLIGTLVLPASITFTLYIILVAIISPVKPIMSLILMAIVFGLPAILIVVTITSPMYIIWMLIYMISLPIWNFILPAYAYWKFDDFSWGDTRKTQDKAKDANIDKGEFDGSQIVQMTWREYEQQRRENETAVPQAYNPSYCTDS